jgi:hypothetical protein
METNGPIYGLAVRPQKYTETSHRKEGLFAFLNEGKNGWEMFGRKRNNSFHKLVLLA